MLTARNLAAFIFILFINYSIHWPYKDTTGNVFKIQEDKKKDKTDRSVSEMHKPAD